MQQKGFWGGEWERSAVGMVMKGGADCEDAPLCVCSHVFCLFWCRASRTEARSPYVARWDVQAGKLVYIWGPIVAELFAKKRKVTARSVERRGRVN